MNNKLLNLQILRGLAAIWVVLFHTNGTLKAMHLEVGSVLDALGSYGYAGVDLFFVISGFVICYSVHRKQQSAREFIISRVERIVPPYALLTGLFALFLLAQSYAMAPSLNHLFRSLLYFSFTNYPYPVLPVGWTLEYEMYFYLIGTIVLLKGWRAFDRIPTIISVLVIIGIVTGIKNSAFDFFTNPLILEFAAGFTIAKVRLSGRRLTFDGSLLIATFAIVALHDVNHRAIIMGIPCAMVVCVAIIANGRMQKSGKAVAALSLLGDASYSIYLVQDLVMPVSINILGRVAKILTPDLLSLLTVSLTIISGIIFYLLIEKKMLLLIRRHTRPAYS